MPFGLFINCFRTAEAALGIYVTGSYAMPLFALDFVILRRIVLPATLPYIIAGIRLPAGGADVGMVITAALRSAS